jgi:hypothetical protein
VKEVKKNEHVRNAKEGLRSPEWHGLRHGTRRKRSMKEKPGRETWKRNMEEQERRPTSAEGLIRILSGVLLRI